MKQTTFTTADFRRECDRRLGKNESGYFDLTETDKAILELCANLNDLAGFTSTLTHDNRETWVNAIHEAIDLLKVHGSDNDLAGM